MVKYFLSGGSIKIIALAILAVFFVFPGASVRAQDDGGNRAKYRGKIQEYTKKGKIEEAIKEAKAYLEVNPGDNEILTMLAESYLLKGDVASAEETIKKVLRSTQKQDAWPLRVMAEVYKIKFETATDNSLKKEYINLAQAQIEEALRVSRDDPVVNAEAAQIYFYQNNKNKATQAIDLALKADPKNEYYLSVKKRIQSMP